MGFGDLLPYLGWLILAGFVLGASGIAASVHNTRMRIRNGYPLEGTWGQTIKPATDNEAKQRISLLTQENAELRAELGSVKDRLVNVERIVTDRGFTLTSEIDALRDSVRDRALQDRTDEGSA